VGRRHRQAFGPHRRGCRTLRGGVADPSVRRLENRRERKSGDVPVGRHGYHDRRVLVHPGTRHDQSRRHRVLEQHRLARSLRDVGHRHLRFRAHSVRRHLPAHVHEYRDVPVSLHAPSVHDGHGAGWDNASAPAASAAAASSSTPASTCAATTATSAASASARAVPRSAGDRDDPRSGEGPNPASEVPCRPDHEAPERAPRRSSDRSEPAAQRDQAPRFPGQARRRSTLGVGPEHRSGRGSGRA
jgi:hypothetical protein